MSHLSDNSEEVTLTIDGKDYLCRKSETVLEAAFRHNIRLSFSCQEGVCQSCLIKAVAGTPSALSQRDIKSTLAAQGYFLACRHKLSEDLTVTLDGAPNAFASVTVLAHETLSDDVCRLRLQKPDDFSYYSGQFVTLRKDSGEIRSYSLASVAEVDGYLELHVRKLPDGMVASWLCDTVRKGDTVDISGPFGECFYVKDEETLDRPMLLIGTGTGLAPLYGILRSALHSAHTGEIFLYHGASTKDKLYLIDELHQLEAQYPNVHYLPCLSQESGQFGFREGRAHDVALSDIKELQGYLVYLCGNPQMVNSARRKAYLQGAAMGDIFADAFTLTKTSSTVTG